MHFLHLIFVLLMRCNTNVKQMESETTFMKRKKSVKLDTADLKALKQYRKKFSTEVECAITLGIGREVLNRVLIVGSGSPETVAKIKEVLSNENNV